MKKFLCSLFVFSITLVNAQTNLSWTSIAPGVWNATIGKPDKLNFYTVVGVAFGNLQEIISFIKNNSL